LNADDDEGEQDGLPRSGDIVKEISMLDVTNLNCGCCGPNSAGERIRYYSRQLLTAEDMRAEQEYFLNRLKRHNRLLHGFGVVCGFEVRKEPASPLSVEICPGYALSPCGNEIWLQKCVPYDLTPCFAEAPDPCTPCSESVASGSDSPTLKERYLAIRYRECPTRPAKTLPAGCGCDDTACEYSRIRDGYEIQCLRTLPKSHEPTKAEAGRPKCEVCPPDDWIVLGKLSYSATTTGSTTTWTMSLDNVVYPYSVPRA
jgi:hypothetical protein